MTEVICDSSDNNPLAWYNACQVVIHNKYKFRNIAKRIRQTGLPSVSVRSKVKL